MVTIPVCPHCQTPIIELINYGSGGILIRSSHVKVLPKDGNLTATLYCKKCNQPMEMPDGWAERFIDSFINVKPKPAIGFNIVMSKGNAK
jgi:uncharacterized protein YbaR (Trm112 family)